VNAEVVPVELVRPLRQLVLRPGRPPGDSVFPGDDDVLAAHVAVRAVRRHAEPVEVPAETGAGSVVAVGSLLPEEPPSWLTAWPGVRPPAGGGRWWRVRGMATAEGRRGRGLGGAVLGLLLQRAAHGGGGVVWCNARLAAESLYRRAGFEEAGEVFEVPGIGPHRVMWRVVPEP
jgi:GNAT superfamily N-acetyltransferase